MFLVTSAIFVFGLNWKPRFNLSELKHYNGLKNDEKKCAHLGGLPQKYIDPSSKILRASRANKHLRFCMWRLVFHSGVPFFPGEVLFFTGVFSFFHSWCFVFHMKSFSFQAVFYFFKKKIPMWSFVAPTRCFIFNVVFHFPREVFHFSHIVPCSSCGVLFFSSFVYVIKWRTLQVARGSGQDPQDPSRFIRSPLCNSEKPEPRADGEILFQEVPENSSSLLCPIHFVPLVPVLLKYFYLISPAGTGLRIFWANHFNRAPSANKRSGAEKPDY